MGKMTIKEAVSAAKKLGIGITGLPTPAAKLPKTKLGALVDGLKDLKELRLAVDKVAEALKDEEARITEHFIETIDANSDGGAVGKRYQAVVMRDVRPIVEDWDALYTFIKKKGEFDLLNRAVNAAAVKERWENKKQVPGVGTFQFKKLSITKVK